METNALKKAFVMQDRVIVMMTLDACQVFYVDKILKLTLLDVVYLPVLAQKLGIDAIIQMPKILLNLSKATIRDNLNQS